VRRRDLLRGGEVRPRGLLAKQGALGEVLPLLKLNQLLTQAQLLFLERPKSLGGVVGQRRLAGSPAVDQARERPADAAEDEGDGRDERELGVSPRSMVGSRGEQ
jgi:hypothetical protein